MTTTSASSPLLHAGTNEVELIEFYLGKESYGVNVSKVLRVVALNECTITPMADAHPAIQGITHIQGNPIPVINLRKTLNLEQTPAQNDRQLLLVLQFNGQVSSYVIDGINKIHRCSWQHFKPVTQSAMGSKGYINGTVRVEDKVILFLDVEYLQNEFIPQSVHDAVDHGPPEIQQARGEVRILFVEDSPMVRKQSANALRKAGYTQIHLAENGRQALDYISQVEKSFSGEHKPINEVVQLILTDVEMPEMDGLTLCKHIKSQYPKGHTPKVIVYSSLINEQMTRKCQSVRADAAISKPQIDRVVEEMDRLCGIGAGSAESS